MTKRTITVASLLLLLTSYALPQENDAAGLVRTVLDKQKTRPFWFRLRSITFGYVPYVFDVRTRVEKYDGDGKTKGPGGGASGVFTPVEGILLYTPTDKRQSKNGNATGRKLSQKLKAEAIRKKRRFAPGKKRN